MGEKVWMSSSGDEKAQEMEESRGVKVSTSHQQRCQYAHSSHAATATPSPSSASTSTASTWMEGSYDDIKVSGWMCVWYLCNQQRGCIIKTLYGQYVSPMSLCIHWWTSWWWCWCCCYCWWGHVHVASWEDDAVRSIIIRHHHDADTSSVLSWLSFFGASPIYI